MSACCSTRGKTALTVAAPAVQRGPQGSYVYVDQARRHGREPRRHGRRRSATASALIDAGLKPDEQVVVDGQSQARSPAAASPSCTARRRRKPSQPERAAGGHPMNISAPFIQRPIATVLLMVGLLLCGLVAYPLLPVAALPNVNYPTISVTAQLPGADPQTMASSVATPLEQQFGQIPGIDADDLVEHARLHLDHPAIRPQPQRRRRRGRRAGGDQRGRRAAAAEHDLSADDPEGEPGGHADPGAGASPPTRCRSPRSTPMPRTSCCRRSRRCRASAWSASAASRSRRSACRSIPQALAARGISLETVRTVLGEANVDLPKGTLNSPRADLHAQHQRPAAQARRLQLR